MYIKQPYNARLNYKLSEKLKPLGYVPTLYMLNTWT